MVAPDKKPATTLPQRSSADLIHDFQKSLHDGKNLGLETWDCGFRPATYSLR
jgi:hypothetical protein